MSEPTTGGPPAAHPHPHGGGELGKKVGPLSVGQWAGAIGGVVVVAWFLRRRAATPSTAPAAGVPAPVNTATQQGIGNLAGATGGVAGSGTGNGLGQVSGPASNQSWLSAAEAALMGQGVDAYTADQALLTYLSGQQLSTSQQAIFDKAVGQVGPVPLPVTAAPGTALASTGVPTLTSPLQGTPQFAAPPPSSALSAQPAALTWIPSVGAEAGLDPNTPVYAFLNGVETQIGTAGGKQQIVPQNTPLYTRNVPATS